MPINVERLLSWLFPDIAHSYGIRDTMLYALGVGAGSEPTDAAELPFVYEDGLKALPSIAVGAGLSRLLAKGPERRCRLDPPAARRAGHDPARAAAGGR